MDDRILYSIKKGSDNKIFIVIVPKIYWDDKRSLMSKLPIDIELFMRMLKKHEINKTGQKCVYEYNGALSVTGVKDWFKSFREFELDADFDRWVKNDLFEHDTVLDPLELCTIEELEEKLKIAIKREMYEECPRIQNIINKRK